MKKIYIAPEMEIEEIVAEELISASILTDDERVYPDDALGKSNKNEGWEVFGE